MAIDAIDIADCLHRIGNMVAYEARLTMRHDFGDGSKVPSNDRCPAGQCLDHDESKGFWPIDRKEQRRSMPEELVLVAVVKLSHVVDKGVSHEWTNTFTVVVAVCFVDLCGNSQRASCAHRDLDRTIDSFLRRNAPHEGKIVVRCLVERIEISR